jgi:hypothetical protein
MELTLAFAPRATGDHQAQFEVRCVSDGGDSTLHALVGHCPPLSVAAEMVGAAAAAPAQQPSDSAADDVTALEHEDPQSLPRQIPSRGQAVVPTADDNRIIVVHCHIGPLFQVAQRRYCGCAPLIICE